MDLFVLKKALTALVLPPAGPLLFALAGLALRRRRPRLGAAMAWLGVLALLALSLPWVSHALLRAVDRTPPLDLSRPLQAQAIVVLGGGLRRAPEYGGDTLGRLTLERVRYGAVVARATKLPVLVSGGAVLGRTEEAALMKRALEEELGVKVRWTENRSRDTRTNAVESAAILLPEGVRRVLLVAHSFDLPRASAEFAAAGLEVVPAPTAVQPARMEIEHPVQALPSMAALHGSYYALYELLAEAVRRVRTARWGRARTRRAGGRARAPCPVRSSPRRRCARAFGATG